MSQKWQNYNMAINFPASPADGDTHEGYVWVAAENAWRRLPETPSMDIENLNNVSVTSPADGESLVYDSATGEWINADATVEVYGVNTTATDYFMIPVGGDADRPVTPANGHIRFNTELGEPEYYSADEGAWFLFREEALSSFTVEYVATAGGGGGGRHYAGGGGAGGLHQGTLSIESGSYTVTIGAGGTGGSAYNGDAGNNGSDTVYLDNSILGGGGGGARDNGETGKAGGSGGGGAGGNPTTAGAGTSGQGANGGTGYDNGGSSQGGGGGGALGVGSSGTSGRSGGTGFSSSISGSTVTYSQGGGGATATTRGVSGGGANTGAGGYGGESGVNGGNGASGVVVLKYPLERSLSVDPGLTYTTTIVTFSQGDFNVTRFTAGTGTVTFS